MAKNARGTSNMCTKKLQGMPHEWLYIKVKLSPVTAFYTSSKRCPRLEILTKPYQKHQQLMFLAVVHKQLLSIWLK